MQNLKGVDFFELENQFWIAERKLNVPLYDFQFSPLFQVARPRNEVSKMLVARLGAIDQYSQMYQQLSEMGFQLINNPLEHHLASELEHWYPKIQELTPRSIVFDQIPTVAQILEHFDFPIFIKGNRQTAKHNPQLAIAHNLTALQFILQAYQQNPILHWQKLVCREFVSLQKLDYQTHQTVPVAFEFRTFWWRGRLAGSGAYWSHLVDYNWSQAQQLQALDVATEAAKRLQVPFLVIDLALTTQGEWIVIECNDGQESGYAGVNVNSLWRTILALED